MKNLKKKTNSYLIAFVNGQTLEQPKEQPKPDIDALRKKLFANTRQDLTNLDFVTTALELRQALIDNGEIDPFVPVGSKIKPTSEDFDKAEKVAKVLQECVDYADGNSDVFTSELKRRIN